MCQHCEDTGYQWDTLNACEKCEKGAEVQYEYNKHDLKAITARAKRLRKKIKEYEEKNKNVT